MGRNTRDLIVLRVIIMTNEVKIFVKISKEPK